MSFKKNPLLYVAALPVAAILGLAGVLFFRNVNSSNLRPFDPDVYLRDWRTLEGNTYLVRGSVHQQIFYEDAKGRLLAVKPYDEAGIPRARPIPLYIPPGLDKTVPFEVGNRYEFTVFVNKGGRVDAQKIKSY